MSKEKSLVMTLPHPHHPIHFLSVVGDSVAQYLLLTSFNNSNPYNPYPHNFPSYTRSIYVQNNTNKSVQYLLLKVNHCDRTTSDFPQHYRPALRVTGILGKNRIQPWYVSYLFLYISMEIVLVFFANYC